MTTIGQRIKARREELGLLQMEIVRRSGVSQVSISRLESDKDKRSTQTASLAHALQVNALWLETGKGKPDLDYVHPVELAKNHHKETKAIIKLLEATDDRGREKALIAVKDALDMHQAWKNSLPRAIEEVDEIAEYAERFIRENTLEILENEDISNDVYNLDNGEARKGRNH